MQNIRWVQLVTFLVLAAFASAAQTEHRGIVRDATTRHIVVPGGLTPANLAAAERDPRVAMLLQLHQNQLRSSYGGISVADSTGLVESTMGLVEPAVSTDVQGAVVAQSGSTPVDWSVSLGTGSVAQEQYPAMFAESSTPSCSDDYVVFALDVAGAKGGQANLIGINQLYSGTNPAEGICGTTPHVNWAYNGSTAGGTILTSPTLSLDGTKVAYVESASSSSILHILTWKAGQGTSATDAASPTLVGSCTASTSCLASVTYSTTSTTTLASVWPDYSSADKAYVASDDGKLYRISCLFHCALNTNPTVDWVFTLPVAGTGGAKPVPTAPVYDGSTYVFIADQLGEVWSIDVSGASPVLAGGPVMVGGGGCKTTNPPGRTGTSGTPCTANGGSYGVPDGVMVAINADEQVFAVSGNDGTANASAVVVEMNATLTSQVRDSIGIGSVGNTTTNVNLYSGDFDNTFWNDPAEGHFYVCGTGTTPATSTQPQDYWIGFTDYPTMNSTVTQASYVNIPISGAACTDLEEMYNPNIDLGKTKDHDMLLGGVIDPTYGPLTLDDISNGSIAEPAIADALFPGGVSNFVVDNTSTDSQASSWYFATLKATSNVTGCSSTPCAVKVHQSTLQ
jgi:hypothetical protein